MTFSNRLTRGLLKAAAPLALLLAAPAMAQSPQSGSQPSDEPSTGQQPNEQPSPQPVPGMEEGPNEVQQAQIEMMQIQQELAPIEQQALQDPEITQRYESLQSRVESAMKETDPKVAEGLERIPKLEQEILAARDAGDQDRMEQLLAEATQLQVQLNEAHEKVMERPEIQQAYEGFRQALIERMKEIDPRTEELIQRAEVLGEQLMQQS